MSDNNDSKALVNRSKENHPEAWARARGRVSASRTTRKDDYTPRFSLEEEINEQIESNEWEE